MMASEQTAKSTGENCFPLLIGGSSLASGWTEHRMAPKSCAKLRCLQCDKKIVRFDNNVRWSSKVDYIFVRNYNTYPEKLKDGLEKADGYASYACQCKWISVNEQTKLEDLDHLKWHCAGH